VGSQIGNGGQRKKVHHRMPVPLTRTHADVARCGERGRGAKGERGREREGEGGTRAEKESKNSIPVVLENGARTNLLARWIPITSLVAMACSVQPPFTTL
jgi:hypothetical protein